MLLTREETKELLPIIQAFVDGKLSSIAQMESFG